MICDSETENRMGKLELRNVIESTFPEIQLPNMSIFYVCTSDAGGTK